MVPSYEPLDPRKYVFIRSENINPDSVIIDGSLDGSITALSANVLEAVAQPQGIVVPGEGFLLMRDCTFIVIGLTSFTAAGGFKSAVEGPQAIGIDADGNAIMRDLSKPEEQVEAYRRIETHTIEVAEVKNNEEVAASKVEQSPLAEQIIVPIEVKGFVFNPNIEIPGKLIAMATKAEAPEDILTLPVLARNPDGSFDWDKKNRSCKIYVNDVKRDYAQYLFTYTMQDGTTWFLFATTPIVEPGENTVPSYDCSGEYVSINEMEFRLFGRFDTIDGKPMGRVDAERGIAYFVEYRGVSSGFLKNLAKKTFSLSQKN